MLGILEFWNLRILESFGNLRISESFWNLFGILEFSGNGISGFDWGKREPVQESELFSGVGASTRREVGFRDGCKCTGGWWWVGNDFPGVDLRDGKNGLQV